MHFLSSNFLAGHLSSIFLFFPISLITVILNAILVFANSWFIVFLIQPLRRRHTGPSSSWLLSHKNT